MAHTAHASVSPQPLIAVRDVPASSAFYQEALGVRSGHGGGDYEQLWADGGLVLQLHSRELDHHHGPIADPATPVGNGLLLWFAIDGFDAAVERVRGLGADVVHDVHVNPNAGHRELWFRDPDGYLVVIAEPFQAR